MGGEVKLLQSVWMSQTVQEIVFIDSVHCSIQAFTMSLKLTDDIFQLLSNGGTQLAFQNSLIRFQAGKPHQRNTFLCIITSFTVIV